MQTDSVQPGTRLAGRYRLDERLQRGDGTAFWRATDELLRRPVGIRTITADSTVAAAVVSAARAASLVSDPRFLHVLDVSEQAGHDGQRPIVYVVSEWVHGNSLGALIRNQGPLAPEEARRIVREVAEALAAIGTLGLAHRAVNPECVVRTESGAVKLVGLGVDAAVAGVDGAADTADVDGAADDARSLGALLYVALTARWPGGPAFGFPAAPVEHGHLCTPRQVRAGVPADLDAVADRALAPQSRHGAALRTPAAVAAALANGHRGGNGRTAFLEPLPAALDVTPTPLPAAWPGRLTAVARAVAALLLVAGVALIGWQLAESGLSDGSAGQPDGEAATAPRPQGSLRVIPIAKGDDFDPEGDNGEERPREVPLATDGNPDTAWRTQSYRQADIGNKSGVGLLLDLGAVNDVRQVSVRLVGTGTDVKLLVSGTKGEEAQDYREVATESGAGEQLQLALDEPVRARYVVVWLTRLPSVGGEFRGGIAEVEVRG